MQIALVQQAASEDRRVNIENGCAAVQKAAAAGAELVAFAELGFDRFFPQRPKGDATNAIAEPVPGPTTERFSQLARELGVVLVLNLYECDGDQRYDSSPVIDRDGTLLGTTRMLHITQYPGFHEQDYYTPGDSGTPVYDTGVGRIGVAICYDRHYPEVFRSLKLAGAELIVVPQAGAVGEWPDGLYEAEMQTAAFQNGVFVALCNRVGQEEELTFAGESFVCDPNGCVIARAPAAEDHLLEARIDKNQIPTSAAERLFLKDRRPQLYEEWFASSTLRHYLAATAYRFQKTVRGAPPEFGDYEAMQGVRSPREIVRHMTEVIRFGCRAFDPTLQKDIPTLPWPGEVTRFHDTLELCDQLLRKGREPNELSQEKLLQGPLADVMTHVGQLAMLRRMCGSPIPGESFVEADIEIGELGEDL